MKVVVVYPTPLAQPETTGCWIAKGPGAQASGLIRARVLGIEATWGIPTSQRAMRSLCSKEGVSLVSPSGILNI